MAPETALRRPVTQDRVRILPVMGSAGTGQSRGGAMTAARADDSVRTTAAAESLFDGRALPAGVAGVVLEAMPDGTCLAELAVTPQTAGRDGDFFPAFQVSHVAPNW
jgi:hypothetical protein